MSQKIKIRVTKGVLLGWSNQLNNHMADVNYFLEKKGKIESHFLNYGALVDQYRSELHAIQKEYCQQQEGAIKFYEQNQEQKEKNEPKEPMMLDGKTKEDFEKATGIFWNEEIYITL